jgi:cleavage stimulation factor subunit 3
MAELTPEMAFLQSMQTEETEPSAIPNQTDYRSDASLHESSSGDESAEGFDAPEEEDEDEDEEEEEEEDEDYDPSALITPSAALANETSNGTALSAPASKPRAKGGFIVDDSDEEDGNADTSAGTNGLNGGAGLTEAQRSLTSTPLNGVASNDVQISRSEDTPSQDNQPTLNVPASLVPVAGATSSTPTPSVPLATNTSEQSRSRATAMPKVRLPTDTIGLLEDRIADDERGDIDAWLSLIDEHRTKNRLDEARNVYERYLKVFPTAVSLLYPFPKTDN